jgi:hypothetical protein
MTSQRQASIFNQLVIYVATYVSTMLISINPYTAGFSAGERFHVSIKLAKHKATIFADRVGNLSDLLIIAIYFNCLRGIPIPPFVVIRVGTEIAFVTT